MYGLLLLAVAIALLFVSRRESFTQITAPPYSQALKDEFWTTLSPTEKEDARNAVRTMQMTQAQIEPAAIEKVASIVAGFYPQYSPTLTQTVLRSKIDAYAGTQAGLRAVATKVLTAYFVDTPATGSTQTGATGTTQTGTSQTGATGTAPSTADGTIQVPDMQRFQLGEAPYSDAEMDRILNLSQTAKTQMQAYLAQQLTADAVQPRLRLELAGFVAIFYMSVYSTLTRPVQESDIDALLTGLFSGPRAPPPEVRPAIKELLMKYYMGSAASQGPSLQQPKSYPELDALYKTKLAEYQTKVATALQTNDVSALPAIRTLNAEISQLLEEMLSSLDPLRQDTEATRRQREELVAVLAQIQREQSGLRDDKDSFGRVRRIREMQRGVKESDLKLYAVLFVSACLGVFIIALSKS